MDAYKYDAQKHQELLALIDTKKAQRAELESQIQALSESLVSLADRYETYVTELPVMRKERLELSNQVQTAAETLARTQEEYQHLLAQKRPHHDLSIEIQQLKTAVEVAKREKEHLETLNSETTEQVKRLEQQVRIKTTRIAELQEEIAATEQTLNKNAKRFHEAENVAASIEQRNATLLANIRTNQELIDELELQKLGVGSAVRKIQAALDKKGVQFDAMKALQA